ncbi:MAG: hypothetical protein IJW80_04235 [Alistipes sp.]|nr:hypothetical protein [Alistipes sp.]
MKKYLVFLVGLLFIVFIPANAQTVGYTYKALAAKGCNVKYSVSKQNNKYYIIAMVTSERLKFLKESTMMVRTQNGVVLKFRGDLVDNVETTAGMVSGNIVIPLTSFTSTSQFEVTPEQFELLKDGIIKVSLSTYPIAHEREFKKDKIGKKLYEFYISAMNQEDDF